MNIIEIKKAINILDAYGHSTKLELFEGVNNGICKNISVDDFESMKSIAIKSLQKEIPKITTETQSVSDVGYICPDCHHISGMRFKYCWNCGQAIRNLEGLSL